MNKIASSPHALTIAHEDPANSLSGYLDSGTNQTSFGPVGQVEGAAPPAFHQTKSIAAFEHTYGGDALPR